MLGPIVNQIVNRNGSERSAACLSTLVQIARNVQQDPEKFGTIKGTNKILMERVWHVEGGLEALQAIGFIPEVDSDNETLLFRFSPATYMAQLPFHIQLLNNGLAAHAWQGDAPTGRIATTRERMMNSKLNKPPRKTAVDISAELRQLADERKARMGSQKASSSNAQPAVPKPQPRKANVPIRETAGPAPQAPGSNTGPKDLAIIVVAFIIVFSNLASHEVKLMTVIVTVLYFAVNHRSSSARVNADGSISRSGQSASRQQRFHGRSKNLNEVKQEARQKEEIRGYVQRKAFGSFF
ncbi:hypothetical protein DFJ77DRAFT_458580 [Powellomyces hirtus]|nr:hypothetical protein DFJ77DRAFT_458580 [Powellomyces hirtus]